MPKDIRALFPNPLEIVQRHIPGATRDTMVGPGHYVARVDIAIECTERFGVDLESCDIDRPRTVGELIDAVTKKL